MAISPLKAIQGFFKTPSLWDGTVKEVTSTELMQLKKASSEEEWMSFATVAAKAIGEELEAPKPKA